MRGKVKDSRKSKKFWVVLIAVAICIPVIYTILGRIYPEENKRIRTQLRERVEEEFPEMAESMRSRYGIKRVSVTGPEDESSAGCVVLVHGLDDPGKVWMNLSPELIKRGYRVWVFSYPDDQSISDSAKFFCEEMHRLRKANIEKVSIIAHSMGGLVARDMLTDPQFAYSDAVMEAQVPAVLNLIMVGTPNHGAELAMLRIFTEFRDQVSSILKGNYIWLEGILDGTGEAGIDLIPGSPFLERLNNRPHPQNLNMVVIAGIMDVATAESMEKVFGEISEDMSQDTGSMEPVGDGFVNSMMYKLGDGLVPVNSARLDGYPLYIVEGTHLSIIRNFSERSNRIPPAIPVIMEYLNSAESK